MSKLCLEPFPGVETFCFAFLKIIETHISPQIHRCFVSGVLLKGSLTCDQEKDPETEPAASQVLADPLLTLHKRRVHGPLCFGSDVFARRQTLLIF